MTPSLLVLQMDFQLTILYFLIILTIPEEISMVFVHTLAENIQREKKHIIHIRRLEKENL